MAALIVANDDVGQDSGDILCLEALVQVRVEVVGCGVVTSSLEVVGACRCSTALRIVYELLAALDSVDNRSSPALARDEVIN